MTNETKRKPLLPRPVPPDQQRTVKEIAEDTIKRFPVTMGYLGRND